MGEWVRDCKAYGPFKKVVKSYIIHTIYHFRPCYPQPVDEEDALIMEAFLCLRGEGAVCFELAYTDAD